MSGAKFQLPPIIGISGYSGVGKDTARQILCEAYGCEGAAFADKVREYALLLNPYFEETKCYYSELIESMGYDNAKRKYDCVRKLMVKIGHGARTLLGQNVWVNALLPIDSQRPAGKSLVISDVRYTNEAERIILLGGIVIRLERNGVNAANETEKNSLMLTPYTYKIENNGSLEDLRQKLLIYS